MTERVLGPTGSPRRRWTLLLPIAAVMALGLFYITGAQAVHDTGAFELDGDATSESGDGGAAPDDWDRVCRQVVGSNCGTTSSTHGATAVAWQDDGALNASIFTGGGSKDPQDITQWAWKDEAGGLPDKDNLIHAFAARYSLPATGPTGSCPNGTNPPTGTCEVIYFGSDRFDNSGDAHQAFWFLQDEVALGSGKVGGGTSFDGVHVNNDLLVISNFSNGGTTSTIFVYKWDSTCTSGVTKPGPGDCGDANLRLLQSSTAALCSDGLDDSDAFCGIVNPDDGTPAPWSYTDKSGNNDYLQGEFYEAGVNLSTLGLAGTCFASVVSETRSSTSTTATLKDFVLESFDVCAPELSTASSVQTSVVRGVTPVFDTATVQIIGAATPPDATGTVSFSLCFSAVSKAAADCTSGGTAVGAAVPLSNADCIPVSGSNTDGKSCAKSLTVNVTGQTGIRGPLAVGFYCWGAVADLTNYDDPPRFHNATTECFEVTDTSSVVTEQRWLPNDKATVTAAGGSTLAGSVDFTLYENNNCSGTPAATFADRPIDANGVALTNNETFYTSNKTISWLAAFDSTNSVADSTGPCETSSIANYDNDITSP
jgi:hypothetical protein